MAICKYICPKIILIPNEANFHINFIIFCLFSGTDLGAEPAEVSVEKPTFESGDSKDVSLITF